MRTEIPEELIETPTLPGGKTLIMLTNKAPLYDDKGKVIGIIGSSLDITERKRAEKREKEALEAQRKGEEEAKRAPMVLAGSIAHDLRTPLLCLSSLSYLIATHLPVFLKYYETVKHDGGNPAPDPDMTEALEIFRDIPHKMNSFIEGMHSFFY